MNEQSPRTSGARPHAEIPARPQWWTDQHTSTWDRVKEALRRDWEQTKADLSSSDAARPQPEHRRHGEAGRGGAAAAAAVGEDPPR